jgi:hypothetical protein
MKRFFAFFLITTFTFIFFTSKVFANLGVGIGTGKIIIDEELKPGTIYKVNTLLNIVNTGDEEGNFKAEVAYQSDQKELMPPKEWIEFSEKEFRLKPGETKTVDVKINVPIKVIPGEYFCYLQGMVAPNIESGETGIGLAAAAKLYFKIAPANFISGIYYRVKSLWMTNQPWTNIGAGAIGIFVIISLIRKNLHIEVGLKNKKENVKKDQENV